MKRLLSLASALALMGFALNLSAQESPATHSTPYTQSSPSTSPQDSTTQQPAGNQGEQGSAQSFEGTITKSGDKLVLKDATTRASYQLDDQDKAKQYEGKKVKVMATMNATTNTLHVVEITPFESR
jgi:hypothetical protein